VSPDIRDARQGIARRQHNTCTKWQQPGGLLKNKSYEEGGEHFRIPKQLEGGGTPLDGIERRADGIEPETTNLNEKEEKERGNWLTRLHDPRLAILATSPRLSGTNLEDGNDGAKTRGES